MFLKVTSALFIKDVCIQTAAKIILKQKVYRELDSRKTFRKQKGTKAKAYQLYKIAILKLFY